MKGMIILLDTLEKIVRVISKIVLKVIMVIGLAMLIIALAHVFARYILNSSLTWSEELLKIMLVWFCLLSASYLAVRKDHVAIVIFKEKLFKRVTPQLELIVRVLMFVASLVVCYIGVRMIISAGSRVTPAMSFPYSVMYAAIAVAFGLMALYELRNMLFAFARPGALSAVEDDKLEEELVADCFDEEQNCNT